MRNFIYSFLLVLFGFSFSSCTMPTHTGQMGRASYVGELPQDALATERIADDCLSILMKDYPPGHTALSVVLPLPGQQKDNFSSYFEKSLREKGFQISSTAPIKVGWLLDALQSSSAQPLDGAVSSDSARNWYITFWIENAGSKRILNRVYDSAGNPVAGFAASGDE